MIIGLFRSSLPISYVTRFWTKPTPTATFFEHITSFQAKEPPNLRISVGYSETSGSAGLHPACTASTLSLAYQRLTYTLGCVLSSVFALKGGCQVRFSGRLQGQKDPKAPSARESNHESLHFLMLGLIEGCSRKLYLTTHDPEGWLWLIIDI
jgi:hypothetical protein